MAEMCPMIQLSTALDAWETGDFETKLKNAIEQLPASHLPLQAALSVSSHVSDRPVQAMILAVSAEPGWIRARVGIFFTGVIAGCSCADDPTPINEANEYCVLQFSIDRNTAEASVTLLLE